MRSIVRIVIVVLSTLIYLSCKTTVNEEMVSTNKLKKIQVNDAINADTSSVKNNIDTMYFIKLSVYGDNPIGVISKAIFTKKNIIVYDEKTNAIFVYDYKGICSCRISRRGKGPGEYFKIKDFDFDHNRNIILIKDNFLNKIIKYDISGRYIEEIKNNHYLSDFCLIGDSKLACYNTRNPLLKKECFQLFYTTIDGQIIKRLLSFDKSFLKDNYVLEDYLSKSDTLNLLINNYSNTIYKIGNETIEGLYYFDFGKYNLPLGKHWKSPDIKGSEYARINNFYETPSMIYLKYHFGVLKSIQMIINKSNGSLLKFSPNSSITYSDEDILWGNILGSYNDFFVFYRDPYSINKYNDNSEEMNNILKENGLLDLKSTDNPVLIFIRYK